MDARKSGMRILGGSDQAPIEEFSRFNTKLRINFCRCENGIEVDTMEIRDLHSWQMRGRLEGEKGKSFKKRRVGTIDPSRKAGRPFWGEIRLN
jgi:hypothetical protein